MDQICLENKRFFPKKEVYNENQPISGVKNLNFSADSYIITKICAILLFRLLWSESRAKCGCFAFIHQTWRRLPGTTRGAGWRNVGLEKWPFEKAQKSREGGWLLDA